MRGRHICHVTRSKDRDDRINVFIYTLVSCIDEWYSASTVWKRGDEMDLRGLGGGVPNAILPSRLVGRGTASIDACGVS